MYHFKKKSNPKQLLQILEFVILIFCSISLTLTFISGLKRSYFFADDFLGLAIFRSPDVLLDLEASAGRPITNIYFYSVTKFFGGIENSYFLIINFLVLLASIIIFMVKSNNQGKVYLSGTIFAICLLISNGSFLPLIFWASNFNHIFSIFLVSVILFSYQNNISIQNNSLITLQSVLYFLLISSNPLYSPFLFAGLITLGIDTLRFNTRTPSKTFLAINVLLRCILPIVYLKFVSLVFLFKNNQYRLGLLDSLVANFRFYSTLEGYFLALGAILVISIILYAFFRNFQRKKYDQLSFLISGLAILVIVLIQENQRGLHYLIIPALLIIPVLLETLIEKFSKPIAKLLLVATLAVTVTFFFNLSSSMYQYFSNTPWGSNLKDLNDDVVSMKLRGLDICVVKGSKFDDWENFIAQIGGGNFFLRPEVGASSVVFVEDKNCPQNLEFTTLLVDNFRDNSFKVVTK